MPSSDRDWLPAPVERLVDLIERGEILKTTEFAGAVSVTTSNIFRSAGECHFDSGAMTDRGSKIILLFHCKSALQEQGVSAWIEWDGENIKRIDATANEIISGLPN